MFLNPKFVKSDVKHWNTLSCLDQYTCRGLRLWNSWDREAVKVDTYTLWMETVKQSGREVVKVDEAP